MQKCFQKLVSLLQRKTTADLQVVLTLPYMNTFLLQSAAIVCVLNTPQHQPSPQHSFIQEKILPFQSNEIISLVLINSNITSQKTVT